MKCPVCKSSYTETDKKCSCCGFSQLNKEFINQDELTNWMEQTVIPCREVYNTMKSKIKKSSGSDRQPASKKKKGLNYDSVVIHPYSFSAKSSYTKCEITDISCKRQENELTRIWFTFLAKKTFDIRGEKETSAIEFRYKIKDPSGIILKTDSWLATGLVVGDVTKGNFCIDHIPDGCTIEFFDY